MTTPGPKTAPCPFRNLKERYTLGIEGYIFYPVKRAI